MLTDSSLSKNIDTTISQEKGALIALSKNIHQHPELRYEEHKATAWICDLLTERGYAVERNLAELPTAFRVSAGKAGGARVAILAEYDALPEIGHACGHNLIAMSAVGAFLAA